MSSWFSTPQTVSDRRGRSLILSVVGPGETEALYPLELAAHSHPMPKSTLLNNLERYRCAGLREGERWLAFALVTVVVGEAELLDIVVDPDEQGQGVGRLLLEAVLDQLQGQAERMFLEVRESNDSAIGLYSALGFVEVGVRHGYYPAAKGREDAILMALELDWR